MQNLSTIEIHVRSVLIRQGKGKTQQEDETGK